MSQDVGSLRCFTHQSSRSYNRSSQRTDIYSGEPIGPPIRSCTTPSLSEYPSSGQSGIEHGFGKDLSRSSTVPIQPLMPTTETADSYFGEYSPGLGVYDNSTSSYNSPDVSYPSSMYTKATGSLSNLSIQSNQYLDSDWDHYKQQQMQGYKSSHFDAPSQPSERPPEPYMAGYNTGLEARPDNGVPKLGSITPTFLAARNSDSSYSQSRRQPAGPKETMQDPLRDDRFHRNYQGSSSAARSCAPALSIHIPPAIIVPSDGTSGSTGIRSVRSAPPSPIPHRGRLRKHQSQESRSNGKNLAVPTAEDLDHRNVRPRANSRVLTEEGRRHANEVRKIGACKACQQKKVKCTHRLESDRPRADPPMLDLPDDFSIGPARLNMTMPFSQPSSPWPSDTFGRDSSLLSPDLLGSFSLYSPSPSSPSAYSTSPPSPYSPMPSSSFDNTFDLTGSDALSPEGIWHI